MKKLPKIIPILVVVFLIVVIGGIVYTCIKPIFKDFTKSFQNKTFIFEEGSLSLTEEFTMIYPYEMDQMSHNSVLYFDNEYVYNIIASNIMPKNLSKSIEDKYKYTVTGNQLNFILNNMAYTAIITDSGDLELEVIGAEPENPDIIGSVSKYKLCNEYDYSYLKNSFSKNREEAYNKQREILIKEIGIILGNSKYEQSRGMANYYFQFNSSDLEHPITVHGRGETISDLEIISVYKASDNLYTLSLGSNSSSENSIFILVIDTENSKITAEYPTIKIPTNIPAYNALGIYEESLKLEFNINYDKEIYSRIIKELENALEINSNGSGGDYIDVPSIPEGKIINARRDILHTLINYEKILEKCN